MPMPQRFLRSLAVLLSFQALAFLLFLPVLHLSLFSDDHTTVWKLGPAGKEHWDHSFFRPVSYASFRLVHALFGDDAATHRAFNIALHGLNAFLLLRVFLVFTQGIDRAHALTGAWMAALLFLVYPFHQEAIVWIVGRHASLATTFTLLTLLALMSSGSLRWRLVLTGVLCFLALGSYESSACLPVLVLPLMWWRLIPGREQVRSFLAVFIAVVALDLIARSWMTDGVVSAYGAGFFSHGVVTYVGNLPKALGRLFLAPLDDPQQQMVRIALVLAALGLILLRSFGRADRQQRKVILAFGWLLILSLWLAVFGGVSTRTSESDRFLYMPSTFLCAMAGAMLAVQASRVLRWGVFTAFMVLSYVAMRYNHANWIMASRMTRGVVEDIRTTPRDHPLLIEQLPDEYEGAYVFRHGLEEALLLNGIDTTGISVREFLSREELEQRGAVQALNRAADGVRAGRLVPAGSIATAHVGEGSERLPVLQPGTRVLRWEP